MPSARQPTLKRIHNSCMVLSNTSCVTRKEEQKSERASTTLPWLPDTLGCWYPSNCSTPTNLRTSAFEWREGVQWDPLSNVHVLSHACHAKEAEPQGTPGRTSDPLAMHIDLTPATQKRRSPKGRQGVHLTPWQCTLSHACHAKAAEPQGTPGRTSDPLAVHVDPTPATQKRRSPTGRQGVHQTPWQCTLSHACHAKEAEPQGTPGRTSDPLAVHIVPRLPRKRGGAPRDARAYIRPLGSAHCPTPATQKRRSPKGRQGVHQTPWQCRLSHACHAKEAEPQGTPGRTSDPLAVHIVPRLPRKRGGAPRDARAYIRPLGSAHCPTPATQKKRSPNWDARAYIRPLGSADCPTPATQKRRSPKGRQGVHPTPWQCTLSHACHAKAAEPQGTPGRTSNPLAVHIVPRLPRKSGGAPRDARAYIQPLGSAHCPTPATQNAHWPTPATRVSECEWVSEWVWVSESESESVSESECECEWVWVCVRSEWVCVCVSEEEDGRARRRIQN